MRALMNLAIEPALKLFEVSALVMAVPAGPAARRVLKVLADTPAGAIRIVRDRYPGSSSHAVVSEQPLPAAAWA
jgi:hypothetical protein